MFSVEPNSLNNHNHLSTRVRQKTGFKQHAEAIYTNVKHEAKECRKGDFTGILLLSF